MQVLALRVSHNLLDAIDAARGGMTRSEYARGLLESAVSTSHSIVVAEPSKSPAPPRSPVVTSTHLRDRSADIAHLRTVMAGKRLTVRQIVGITDWPALRIDKALSLMSKEITNHGGGVMSLST